MGYQVPKASHPWRRYANRPASEAPAAPVKKVKPVRMFVLELVESWDHIEVIASMSSGSGHCSLVDLPQEKQAAWLANLLKRSYI